MRAVALLMTMGAILTACAAEDRAPVDPVAYAYNDWLYHPYGWYDDPFWVWVDDNPGCCDSGDDLRAALEGWWGGLDPDQQDTVRDQADQWLADHDLEPAPGESRRDLILDTAAERWEALTLEDRQAWLVDRQERVARRRELSDQMTPDQRAELRARVEDLTPEQKAAARDRLADTAGAHGVDRNDVARLRDSHRFEYRMVNHPTPSRAGLQATPRFRHPGHRGSGRGRR
jgi:hypothetical protein